MKLGRWSSLAIVAAMAAGSMCLAADTPEGDATPAAEHVSGDAPKHEGRAAHNEKAKKLIFLGVEVGPVDPALRAQFELPEGTGLMVQEVVPGSPAAQAGLKKYDVLQKLDDQLLINAEQLAVLVRTHKAGDSVALSVIHGGKSDTVSPKLIETEAPAMQGGEFRGGQGGRGGMERSGFRRGGQRFGSRGGMMERGGPMMERGFRRFGPGAREGGQRWGGGEREFGQQGFGQRGFDRFGGQWQGRGGPMMRHGMMGRGMMGRGGPMMGRGMMGRGGMMGQGGPMMGRGMMGRVSPMMDEGGPMMGRGGPDGGFRGFGRGGGQAQGERSEQRWGNQNRPGFDRFGPGAQQRGGPDDGNTNGDDNGPAPRRDFDGPGGGERGPGMGRSMQRGGSGSRDDNVLDRMRARRERELRGGPTTQPNE